DRSFCTSGTSGAQSGCNGGAAGPILPPLSPGGQGGEHPPPTRGGAGFAKPPATRARAAHPAACGGTGRARITRGPRNDLASTNFFRSRDTFRQDAIDESQLVQVLAPATTAATNASSVVAHMITRGVIVDASKVYFSGQSLGAIQGAMDVASNPRISRAAFNV